MHKHNHAPRFLQLVFLCLFYFFLVKRMNMMMMMMPWYLSVGKKCMCTVLGVGGM